MELFLFVIVQTFASSLPSVTEQAALLQVGEGEGQERRLSK